MSVTLGETAITSDKWTMAYRATDGITDQTVLHALTPEDLQRSACNLRCLDIDRTTWVIPWRLGSSLKALCDACGALVADYERSAPQGGDG